MWVKKTTSTGSAAPRLRRNASAIAARRHCGYGATPLRLWRKEDAVVVQHQMGEPAKLLGCWSFGLRPAVLECHSSTRMNASRQLRRGRPGVFGHRSPTHKKRHGAKNLPRFVFCRKRWRKQPFTLFKSIIQRRFVPSSINLRHE